MDRADLPPDGALAEVLRRAGPGARLKAATRLAGGQHADTWRVDTVDPASSVVVRRFPEGDDAAGVEQARLAILDGLDGLAPVALGADEAGRWSLISRVDGEVDIDPDDPDAWARQLGTVLARVHGVSVARLAGLPSVFSDSFAFDRVDGPLAPRVRDAWDRITAAPRVLTHNDYWSGNVVWRDGRLSGVVDWTGALLGPRGYDVAWCRLDLVLLFGEPLADVCLAAYDSASGGALGPVALWDEWAAARSHSSVHEWDANYVPLGRPDLDAGGLRRRHAEWTQRLLARG